MPQLVQRQAAATPHAPALIDGDCTVSYAELCAHAGALTLRLRAMGAGPETVIGLCVERSASMAVGALAILMSGAAYLPLDPAYPVERLNHMLQDAAVPVILTQDALVDRLSEGEWRTMLLDSTPDHPLSAFSQDLPMGASPRDLAYVIYTSGSTGQPKGVEIEHGSLLNLVRWHQEAFGITPADRATQLASPGFDAAVWELWPYLTAGASVYFVDEKTRVSPKRLRDWLLDHGITVTFLPSSLAERVVDLPWPNNAALRVMLTGADILHRYPPPGLPFTLVNNYGPTEAAVVATSGPVAPQANPTARPSIGRPIAGTRVYLLDDNLQPVPDGEPGELFIGGAGVARGYLNRPVLTAERFVTSPFDDADRLYRTGDRTIRLPDSRLHFLGRADDQVKIRGYRIEPGEIVTLLNRHLDVQSSAVVAREDAPGDRQLVAYVVLSDGQQPVASSLREYLAAQLPDYMVPPVFVSLAALPLNASGKLDPAALPVPQDGNLLPASVGDTPRTPLEKRVAAILAELLEIEQVGIHDNFFLLGGHSLLATQVIIWVDSNFAVDLPMRVLFDAPTVAQLASEIERRLIARLETLSDEDVARMLSA